MRLPGPALLYLQTRLLCNRFGWINSIAFAMIFSGALFGWWFLSYLQVQADAPLIKIRQAQKSLHDMSNDTTAPPLPVITQRINEFYDILGDKRYAEQQVKTLFSVANKSGLLLKQAEYVSTYDKNDYIYTYQVILPVKGNYESIRNFCEQTLLTIPFASLDEISFKRDTINNQVLEAKLRFSFYLADLKALAVTGHLNNLPVGREASQ